MEHRQRNHVRTQRNGNGRAYPELVVSNNGEGVTYVSEREATYQAALKLVARIDDDLTKGIRHYRNRAGVLLTTLDEVVRAILEDDLQPEAEPQRVEKVWLSPQELAA